MAALFSILNIKNKQTNTFIGYISFGRTTNGYITPPPHMSIKLHEHNLTIKTQLYRIFTRSNKLNNNPSPCQRPAPSRFRLLGGYTRCGADLNPMFVFVLLPIRKSAERGKCLNPPSQPTPMLSHANLRVLSIDNQVLYLKVADLRKFGKSSGFCVMVCAECHR